MLARKRPPRLRLRRSHPSCIRRGVAGLRWVKTRTTYLACRCVKYFKNVPLKAIYATPLERTQETAEPLAHAFGLTVQIAREMTEVDYGVFPICYNSLVCNRCTRYG
jgi:hypothetical protein